MNGFRKSLQSGSSLSGPASPKASLSGPAPADGLPTSGVASIAGSEARRMGRYEALARLGNGGMATVFVGRPIGDVDLSRLVALKRAHEHVRQDPDLVDGLKKEARLAARIDHPNVVGVIEVQEDAHDVILVLDYVEGCTLAELMRRIDTAKHPREMLGILFDIAAGLDAAHATTDDSGQPLHLVHRDVSPSNVLIGRDGIARIADFGVAKTLERESEQTATGILKGKLAYMAPEYVERHYVDARSDLFSLAVVGWEMLTGDRLFRGPTELETLKRVAAQNVPSPSEYSPDLAVFDGTLLRALARDPDHRFPTVGEFARTMEMKARAGNLIGSHVEVAALIESVFGRELDERRRRFAGMPSEPSQPAAQFHLYPVMDAAPSSFTQSAPAQSVTQSGALTPRSKLGIAISLLLVVVIGAVSVGAILGHRPSAPIASPPVVQAAPPPSPAPSAVANPPEVDPATFGAAETQEILPSREAQESVAPPAVRPTSSAAPNAAAASAKAAKVQPPPSHPRNPTAAPAPASLAPPSHIIPAKPPPNPYGP